MFDAAIDETKTVIGEFRQSAQIGFLDIGTRHNECELVCLIFVD